MNGVVRAVFHNERCSRLNFSNAKVNFAKHFKELNLWLLYSNRSLLAGKLSVLKGHLERVCMQAMLVRYA